MSFSVNRTGRGYQAGDRRPPDSRRRVAEVNGVPAIVAMDRAEVRGVLVIEAGEGRITGLRAVANSDKLR